MLAKQRDVADVLLAHGARADDADPKRPGASLRQGGDRDGDRGGDGLGNFRQRQAAERGEDAARRDEGVAGVHDQRIVDEQDVALFPCEDDAAFFHELRDGPHDLLIDGRAVAKFDRLLADVPGIVPAREGRDHGVEEDALACALVHPERRQNRRDGLAVAIGQPLPSCALFPHRCLSLGARGDIVRLLPRAALSRGRVRDLGRHADVPHAKFLNPFGKLREAALEERRHLGRVDDRSGTALLGLDLAAEEDVGGRRGRLSELVVEGDGLIWGRLVRGEDETFD
mmetsp:Transcript_168894/g.542901  ORF Transcript_168894/g.542901 Transcript_168894/m.542901 type:complete len:284 (-) Transcript_168894:381-1232(-)